MDICNIIKNLQKKYFQPLQNDQPIFLHENGSQIRPDYITRLFRKIADNLRFGNTRFHDLHHTHTTWMPQANVNPKVIQERLGLAAITITRKIYSHVVPSMQKDAVSKLMLLRNQEFRLQNGDKITNLPIKV